MNFTDVIICLIAFLCLDYYRRYRILKKEFDISMTSYLHLKILKETIYKNEDAFGFFFLICGWFFGKWIAFYF